MSAANVSVGYGAGAETFETSVVPFERDRLDDIAATVGSDGVRALVTLFVEQTRDRIRRVRDAVTIASASTIERETHNLRGASATMGAVRLAQLAEELGVAARDGDATGVAVLVPALTDEADALAASLAAYVAGLGCRATH